MKHDGTTAKSQEPVSIGEMVNEEQMLVDSHRSELDRRTDSRKRIVGFAQINERLAAASRTKLVVATLPNALERNRERIVRKVFHEKIYLKKTLKYFVDKILRCNFAPLFVVSIQNAKTFLEFARKKLLL
jgi:hypothetical protein